MLRNGTAAPDFRLPDTDNAPRALADLRHGAPLALYFFRCAGCPSARRDLAAWVETHNRITDFGASMVAISADSVENHRYLKERLGAPYPILSDVGFKVSETYGVYRSDDGEEPEPHGEPAIFVLDVDGRIAYSQVQTGPKGSANPYAIALVLFYMSRNDGRY